MFLKAVRWLSLCCSISFFRRSQRAPGRLPFPAPCGAVSWIQPFAIRLCSATKAGSCTRSFMAPSSGSGEAFPKAVLSVSAAREGVPRRSLRGTSCGMGSGNGKTAGTCELRELGRDVGAEGALGIGDPWRSSPGVEEVRADKDEAARLWVDRHLFCGISCGTGSGKGKTAGTEASLVSHGGGDPQRVGDRVELRGTTPFRSKAALKRREALALCMDACSTVASSMWGATSRSSEKPRFGLGILVPSKDLRCRLCSSRRRFSRTDPSAKSSSGSSSLKSWCTETIPYGTGHAVHCSCKQQHWKAPGA